MLRYESLVHNDVFAAGPRQPAGEPIILDLDIADRQQKKRPVMGWGVAGRGDEGAESDPARMIAAAGERPFAAEDIAAIRRRGCAGRCKTSAAERIGPIALQLALRLDREMGE